MSGRVGEVTTPPPEPRMRWRTSDEALDRYDERLLKPLGPSPIIFPYRTLWEFGGFARVVIPGLLITVVGMAGGMKTAFVEMLTEKWRQQGSNDVLWWGTEWSWEQMADRAIQRYGGASVEGMALHSLWLHEAKDGVPEKARMGRELPKELQDRSRRITQAIKSWPGINHMTEEIVSDLDELLELQGERILELASSGRIVRFCVWDYLQLLDLSGANSESERLSNVMGKLQLFCARYQVVGITASQVTKNAAYAARKEGETLTAESGQNFRSDKPKLVLTLRPLTRGGLITNEAEIVVDKNNAGRSGKKIVRIDPAHYLWLDEDEKASLPF